MITPTQLEQLLPLACQWAQEQEDHILRCGTPLTAGGLDDATNAGVQRPGAVRVLYVHAIPVPEHPALRAAAAATSLLTPNTAGLTLRYGVLIRLDCAANRPLLVHELAHTAQYERLGGFMPFLQRYLLECVTIGYPAAPMEQEAVAVAARVCQARGLL